MGTPYGKWVHVLEMIWKESSPAVRLAAAVADEAFAHLEKCKRVPCRRCHQDIAWYERRGCADLYSLESIAQVIGVHEEWLRKVFVVVVVKAQERLKQARQLEERSKVCTLAKTNMTISVSA